jgi:LDH2 family malate/lactate/ureidoglycolate dehydrogenase
MEDKGSSNNRGSLVIVINPDYVFGLNTLEDFRSNAMTMCDRVKNAKKIPTDDASNSNSDGGGKDDSIMLPGERGDLLMEENLRQGTIVMLDNVYDDLVKLAQQ